MRRADSLSHAKYKIVDLGEPTGHRRGSAHELTTAVSSGRPGSFIGDLHCVFRLADRWMDGLSRSESVQRVHRFARLLSDVGGRALIAVWHHMG